MLRQTCLLVCPEHLVSLVPCVAVESCLWVESALVSLAYLVNGIVVDFLSLLGLQQHVGCKGTVGQSHENSVEPHLIGINCLVPIYTFLCAWLLVELLHECLHGSEVLCLWIKTIHTGHKVSRTYLVEVIVLYFVCLYCSFGVYHRVGIELTVFPYVVATIF